MHYSSLIKYAYINTAAYTFALWVSLWMLCNPAQYVNNQLIVAKTWYNLKILNIQTEDINCIFKD